MKKHKRNKTVIRAFKITKIVDAAKTAIPFIAVILALKILCSASFTQALGELGKSAGESDKVFGTALFFEFGASPKKELSTQLISITLPGFAAAAETKTTAAASENKRPAQPSPTPTVTPPPPSEQPKPTSAAKPTPILTAEGITLKGETEGIDIARLFGDKLNLSVGAGPQILIIHTHSTESYYCDGSYKESGNSHTLDGRYSVIRVGEELKTALDEKGYTAIHDMGIYDFPSYTGSYERSLSAIQNYLVKYPSIKIVLDIHRDAATDTNGNAIKASTNINGSSTAQIMLVVGKGTLELPNPHWEDNMKLALRLQAAMNAKYPGLARPISVSSNRYNEHLSTGSLLAEIGCNGNSLEEALISARLLADSLALALSGY